MESYQVADRLVKEQHKNPLLVSVIIPVYNVAPYLREAVDSVIYQTYTNLEVLVIDDGSTDGSGAICDEYARRDRRIRVVHQENKGLSTARNVGLDMMTGDAVAFLDPDDAFDHRMVEVMLDALRHADIAVCGISVHRGMKRMHPKKGGNGWRTLNRTEALLEIMNGRMETAPWNKLYKKQIWEALRFPDGHVHEGSCIVYDLFARAELVIMIDRKLVMHRSRPGSICNTTSVKNIQDACNSREHQFVFVKEHSPGLFSRKQVEKADRIRIYGMMAGYIKYSFKHPEDLQGRNILREMLVNAKKEVGLARCSLPARLGYYPVLLCPRLCMPLYDSYRAVRKLRQVIRSLSIGSV